MPNFNSRVFAFNRPTHGANGWRLRSALTSLAEASVVEGKVLPLNHFTVSHKPQCSQAATGTIAFSMVTDDNCLTSFFSSKAII